MRLLAVIEIEAFMVNGNLNLVEKRLEVGVPIERIEQLVERNIRELRKSQEPVNEKPNVVIARFLGTKSTFVGSNHELARLSYLGIPSSETDVLDNNRNHHNRNHIHRSVSISNLLLQSINLLLLKCNLYNKNMSMSMY